MALIFACLGLSLVLFAHSAAEYSIWASGALAYCAISTFLFSAAYALRKPSFLLKNPERGVLRPASWLLLAPIHLLNRLLLYVTAWTRKARSWDLVEKNVYLGRRPLLIDQSSFKQLNVHAVLDLTCEFDELPWVRSRNAYLCLPVLDRTSPTLEQLEQATRFIAENAALGNVYVHCAVGHGRSATVVAAHLLASHSAQNVEEAIQMIRIKRPHIHPNREQLEMLAHFSERLSRKA